MPPHTDGMEKQVTFTFAISDPELSGEEIFEQVQMLMYEEFHGRAEVSYGSPDDLINGDDLADGALRDGADEAIAKMTSEQAKRLLKAIFEGDLGKADESDEQIPYAFRVAFTASRILKASEIGALENALCAQVEDPHVPDEDGEFVRPEFTISNAVVGLEP